MNALTHAVAQSDSAQDHDPLQRARELLQSTLDFVREQAQPWPDSGVLKASADPYVISRFGDLHIRIEVAVALQERAEALLANEPDIAEVGVAQAEAAIAASEALLAVSNAEFELTGQRSPLPGSLHDPVRWQYPLIGNYRLNGVVPARFRSAV